MKKLVSIAPLRLFVPDSAPSIADNALTLHER